jgi:hypothetical protein
MKTLLNTTLLFLLVIGFSGGASGQDFDETKRRAEQGIASAQALLGVWYDEGEIVPENDAEAIRWYRLAAEQGHVSAQSTLGVMYRSGTGVPQNLSEAVRWYRLAAEQGMSQTILGVMYYRGRGVPQNDVRAYMWWSVAAAQGDETARYFRDIVAASLSSFQLARGQEMATRCFESDFQDCE